MKSAAGYLPHLDGWRGLAIATVFFGHFFAKAQFWWVGSFGVQLFFVLSGYLMCNILFFKSTPLPAFFVKRLIRVAPTFVLFVVAITVYAQTFQPVKYFPSTAEVISTLIFLRSYFPADLGIINGKWPIGHLWSLNVEEHAYIFLAFLAFFTRKANRVWLTGGLLITATICILALNHYYFNHPPAGATSGNLRSEAASLGIVAAVTLSFLKQYWFGRFTERVPRWTSLACIGMAFLCFSKFRWCGIHYTVAPILLAIAINYLDRVPVALMKILSAASLMWLGRVSFSLYLWQQPFHFAVTTYGMNAILGIVLAVATGLASYYLFENPVRLFLTELWERKLRADIVLAGRIA